MIQTLVPQSVPEGMLAQAHAINSTAYTTARMIGPLAGGGLVDSMVPEAVRKGGDTAGLVTVLGFAVAAALSALS